MNKNMENDVVEKSKKLKSNIEDKNSIIQLLLKGITSEEINKMEQFKKYSLEETKKLEESCKIEILAMKLMPVTEIAGKLGVKLQAVYMSLRRFKSNGIDIMEIRKEKEQEVERRLEAGESAENILQDKNLNVCLEALEQIKQKVEKKIEKDRRKLSQSQKDKVGQLLLQGKTIDEIHEMEEFKGYNKEILTKVEERNMARILAVQLMPVSEIARKLDRETVTIYSNIKDYKLGDRSIMEIRKEKEQEIMRKLREGESIETIIRDRELNVCEEGVRYIKENRRYERKGREKKAIEPKTTKTKVAEQKKAKPRDVKQNVQGQNGEKPKAVKTATTPIKENTETNKESEQTSETHKKLELMRRKYKEKYSLKIGQDNNRKQDKELTMREKEIVNNCLEKMMQAVDNWDGSRTNAKELIKTIFDNAKTVYDKNIDMEQATQLVSIMDSSNVEAALKYFKDVIALKINGIRKKAYRKLAEKISEEMEETDDLETLEKLEKKMTTQMEKENLAVLNVRTNLSKKIERIKREEITKRIREDIPTELQTIISGLAKGKLDVEEAKKVIENMAKNRVEQKKATKFTLTEEQVRKRYLMQISKALSEQAEKYPIENPEQTMQLLQSLTNGSFLLQLNTVVENLVSRKEFEEADKICQSYVSKTNNNIEAFAYIKNLRKRTRNAKIGDLVYRTIHSNLSSEEEEKFWGLLQEGLGRNNVKMANIVVGKTQDGLRSITLEDIWPEKVVELKKG